MGKVINRDKLVQIFTGIVLAVAGIVTIVLAIVDKGILDNIFSVIVAVSLFILGGVLIITNILKSAYNVLDSNYLAGAVAIALGVAFCVNKGFLPGILVQVISITVLTYGASILLKGIIFTIKKSPKKYIVAAFIISPILIAAGILGLIFNSETKSFIYIVTGVALIVFGTLNLIQTIQD